MDKNSTINLLKEYSRERHLAILKNNMDLSRSRLNGIQPIMSELWVDDEDKVPYVAKTHLLDSYYCLPERPDMAFTHLWKAINSAYNNYYLKQVHGNQSCISMSDSKSLEKIIEHISDNLGRSFEVEGERKTIKCLLDLYYKKIPIKTLNFVSSYILKGIAIEHHRVPSIYASSSYKSFKKKFDNMHQIIKSTYGVKYQGICNLRVRSCKTEIDYNISDKEKSRKLIHSLSESLKKALVNDSVSLDDGSCISFDTEKEKIEFVLLCILYSIRNNNSHGNVASRMNSVYANKDSFRAAEYVYLAGHMFVSLIMYKNEDITINDLHINFQNI